MSDEYGQTLAAFVLDTGKQSRRLLKRIQEIDAVDANVKIVDAAIVDRTRFRVKVHQTEDLGGAKGTVRGAGLGVIVGALVLGPAGAVVGGAAGGVLNGLRNRFHDVGIDDKFMRQVAKEIERGKSALFILYEGNWAASRGMIEQAITVEKALLIASTLPPKTAAALKALVDPAVEQLGGAEVVNDYEVEAPEAPAAEAAPAVAAAAAVAAVEAAPAEAAPAATPDDLTQLSGVGPKASAALATAGITTYAALAQANEPELRHALHEADMVPPANVASWPMQATYATRGDWQGLMKYNNRGSEPRHHAETKSKAAEAAPPDDLTQLSGIGPRISSILADGGVTTYAQLEHTDPSELRKVVAQSGALPPSSLDTWPTQASYAVRGDWQGLASYNHNR
jgi:predicted flap endonuclease-1-like 5' DNA nuclease